MNTKTCIRDVAERAGVSAATVSNALGGKRGVSEEVAERVRRIATEMGYTIPRERPEGRNRYVRLVIYRSHGRVVMDNQFFADLIESVQRECEAARLEMTVSHLDGRMDDVAYRVKELCQESCVGLVLLGTEMTPEQLAGFTGCRAPLVVLDNHFCHQKVSSVVMNNQDAAYQAVTELWNQGHRDIQHITSSVYFANAEARCQGYIDAMAEHGVTVGREQVWSVRPTMDGAREDMKRYLASGRKLPTAFFAMNDISAVGCMRALAEEGIRVPEDVSVIGMDDTAVGQANIPAVTTVRVHRKEMGVTAVKMLLYLIPSLESCGVKAQVGVEIIHRDSVAPPRGSKIV